MFWNLRLKRKLSLNHELAKTRKYLSNHLYNQAPRQKMNRFDSRKNFVWIHLPRQLSKPIKKPTNTKIYWLRWRKNYKKLLKQTKQEWHSRQNDIICECRDDKFLVFLHLRQEIANLKLEQDTSKFLQPNLCLMKDKKSRQSIKSKADKAKNFHCERNP